MDTFYVESLEDKTSSIRVLEKGTVKVPYEVLNKQYRSVQRSLEKEVSQSIKSVEGLQRARTVTEVDKILTGVIENLSRLKRKAACCLTEELDAVQTCKRRVEHLRHYQEMRSPTAESFWRRQRLDRCVVDYLLHQGYYSTAEMLANRTAGLEALTHLALFRQSRVVEDALANRQTAPALLWCADNRSKLRKLGSQFEFRLRLQEFVELVKVGKKLDAMKYARKFLSTWVLGIEQHGSNAARGTDDEEDLCEARGSMNASESTALRNGEPSPMDLIQSAMLLLAYPEGRLNQETMNALDDWSGLVRMFRVVNRLVFSFEKDDLNVFCTAVQAGLAAMKTHECYKEDGEVLLTTTLPLTKRSQTVPTDCPVCHPLLNELARDLPFAHSAQSKLVCSVTGLPMNEHNPPMCLPNGHVYSQQALVDLMLINDGDIVCPRTQRSFGVDEAQKVFIM